MKLLRKLKNKIVYSVQKAKKKREFKKMSEKCKELGHDNFQIHATKYSKHWWCNACKYYVKVEKDYKNERN